MWRRKPLAPSPGRRSTARPGARGLRSIMEAILLDLTGRLANDQAAGAFPSMTLFLVATVVIASGLLGALVVLMRDAPPQGTKPKRFLVSNWK